MKSQFPVEKHFSGLFLCALLISAATAGYAQVPLTKSANPVSPYSTSSMVENNTRIGLGTVTPSAKFHINSDISSGTPFKIDTYIYNYGNTSPYGSIETFVSKNGQMYGLYQSNVAGLDLLNYFKSNVKVGNVKVWSEYGSTSSGIALDSNLTSFNFTLTAGSGPAVHPLTIDIHGITVNSKVTTSELQLLTDPGLNYVMVSDAEGNASWADPDEFSLADDDWYFNNEGALYANTTKVGIGTRSPQSGLHVVDENIMISRSPMEAPGSRNGSILFGKVIDSLHPLGEWGIEYLDFEDDYMKGGLNFWKVYNNQYAGGDNRLFIRNDGWISIGNSNPRGKLEIELNQADTTIYGIILNQTATFKNSGSEIRFDRNGIEEWAVGARNCGDTMPAFFIWNEARAISSLFIEKGTGNMGVENQWPTAKLDVNGSFKALSVGIGTQPPPAESSWKLFVEGGIKAREILVTVQPFADYVFAEDYPLLSIRELDTFIRNNKHLPGIPSSEEVEKNEGINLGEMQVKLLEKIEEQALYIVDLQNQIDEFVRLQNNFH